MFRFPILEGQFLLDSDVLLRHAHLEDGDIVVVGGTLIEGVGNSMSDIDNYVICNRRKLKHEVSSFRHACTQNRNMSFCEEREEVFVTMDYYPDSSFHLEFEYWTPSEISQIVAKVESSHAELMSHADTNYAKSGLSRLEQLLLHRINTGITISGSDTWRSETAQRVRQIYPYTLYRVFANEYWDFKDLVGAYASGNALMTCDQAKEFLVREVRGMCFLNGLTNSTQKWYVTYLKLLAVDPKYEAIEEKVCRLLFSADPKKYDDFVEQVFDAVDEIEHMNRELLDANPNFLSCSRAMALLAEERRTRSSTECKAQEHEFLFRSRTYSDQYPSYRELLKWKF